MGTSCQKGWVWLRGKKWYGYFRRAELDPATDQQRPAVAQVILRPKTEMSKFQARAKLEEEIAAQGKQPLNGDKSMINGAVTFRWFVLHRYLPLKEADWRHETAKVKKHIIQTDLVSEFGDVRLETFDKFTLQTHLKSWPRRGRGTESCKFGHTSKPSSRKRSTRTFYRKIRRAR